MDRGIGRTEGAVSSRSRDEPSRQELFENGYGLRLQFDGARENGALAAVAGGATSVPLADPAEPVTPAEVLIRPPSWRAAETTSRRLLDPSRRSVRFLVDLAALILGVCNALLVPILHPRGNLPLAAIFIVLTLGILQLRHDRRRRLVVSAFDTSTLVLGAVSVGAMLTITAAAVLGVAHPLRLAVGLWFFGLLYLGAAHVILLSVLRASRRDPSLGVPTLIVGAGVVAARLVARLTSEPLYGLRPVGILDADPAFAEAQLRGLSIPVLGRPSDLPDVLALSGARHVILAFSSEPDRGLVDRVKECQDRRIGFSLVPRLFDAVNERATLDYVGGLPLLTLRPTDPSGWQFAVKHALDRSVAFVSLLVLAPLMAAIAIAVRLTSPGPALFRQRRVGRDGRVFDLLKFRTMREATPRDRFEPPDGCAPGGVEGEDRRTPIGAFLRATSLDELPQLFNVLAGEMSLVGPRPERPEFTSRFAREIARYDDRHRVKSGITGWAQVNGLRGQTSIADRVEWDNYYIENWSLGLDLRILALTILTVLQFDGN